MVAGPRAGRADRTGANADGSGLTRLTDNPDADFEPTWSPDGARIAFVSVRDDQQHLYVMNADGSNVQRVTDEVQDIVVPVWSPDSAWIAFSGVTDSSFMDIFIVRPDGSDLRKLTDWQGIDTAPTWSQSSQQLAYQSDAGAGDMLDIFVVNIDGTGRANLTNDVTQQREPHWSSDGARIAFSHASHEVEIEPGYTGIYDTIAIYNTTMQGGNPFRTTSILGSTPRWSPDGHYLAYRRFISEPGRTGTTAETLHLLQADGLETGRIPGIEGAMLIYDWSPDGQALAVATTNVDTDGNPGDERALWLAQLDGSAPVLLAEQLESWTRPAWRPDPSRTPKPSKTPPDLTLPTATPDTSEPSAPVTPNALDSMGQLQPGQERHFVFDISADYRLDESSFLTWNVKGSERMLPDGTLQTYAIARDASNTVLIEYVNDGERWWWNQRGWIESGTTERGVVRLPEELRIALQEPQSAWRALHTDELQVIDVRSEGDAHITRYRLDGTEWLTSQRYGIEVERAYYEVYSTIDLSQISRTRTVLVTPNDDERPEYALADITFESVTLIDAEDGPSNYVVPEGPADGTLRYTPPPTLPGGLTIERHWREPSGGMELMTISGSSGLQINAAILPSRGGHDPRPMRNRATLRDGHIVAGGVLAGGEISWLAEETNGWPIEAIWDDGRYRIELSISNVESHDQWNEDDLVALIYALAGEEQN